MNAALVVGLSGTTDEFACERCGGTSKRSCNSAPERRVCNECRSRESVIRQVTMVAVDMRLRVVGAASLLRLGYAVAAARVLDGKPWPSLREAKDMQAREIALQKWVHGLGEG